MQDSIFIGLDVHKATISIAIAKNERGGEVRHWGTIPHRPDHVRKLVEKLGADQSQLCFRYEAGPCGYGLHRQLALRANNGETTDCLKFTLEGAGERSDGNARTSTHSFGLLA